MIGPGGSRDNGIMLRLKNITIEGITVKNIFQYLCSLADIGFYSSTTAVIYLSRIGKPQKKVPKRPNPPPSSLIAVGTLEKKVKKKFLFPSWPSPLPSPSPLNGPVIKIRTSFCGFPNAEEK